MELQNVILLLLLTINLAIAQNTSREEAQELHVGVILDLGSIVGKMARTSVSLAMEDFYAVHRNYSTKLVLHIRDSMSDDVQAASQGTCSQLLVIGHCISSFCYAAEKHNRKKERSTKPWKSRNYKYSYFTTCGEKQANMTHVMTIESYQQVQLGSNCASHNITIKSNWISTSHQTIPKITSKNYWILFTRGVASGPQAPVLLLCK